MSQILVVDDDPQVRNSIQGILEDAGYQVSVVDSGHAALAWLNKQQPDLIVLDIIMPGLSGIDLCRRLRADPFLSRIPIIFLTAKSRQTDIAAGLDAGADDYVTKPVQVLELPARVRALLRRTTGGTLDAHSDT